MAHLPDEMYKHINFDNDKTMSKTSEEMNVTILAKLLEKYYSRRVGKTKTIEQITVEIRDTSNLNHESYRITLEAMREAVLTHQSEMINTLRLELEQVKRENKMLNDMIDNVPTP